MTQSLNLFIRRRILLDAISKYIKAFSQVLQRLIKTKAKIIFNRVAMVSGLS